MVGKLLKWGGLVMLFLSVSAPVLAQEESPLLGFWKQKSNSVYIQITEENDILNAEVLRNDWSPGLVGVVVFQKIKSTKKNRWLGDAFIVGSDELGVVTISLSKGTELTTRVKPGRKKIKWIRSDPVEKRY